MKNNLANWIAFNQIHSLSLKKILLILEHFPDLNLFWQSSTKDLTQLGFSSDLITTMQNINWSIIEKELRWAEQPNHHIVPFYDKNYPSLLKEIANPPPLLYIKGPIEALHTTQIAIVGTRKPTLNGLQVAKYLAHDLIANGFTITSGLAYGIDITTHEAVLAKQAKTIAVLANGLYSVYPTRHTQIAQEIVDKGGCLIAEFPLATRPRPEFFPKRNRIISGLSLGVLVIEADILSGSLITAKHALEQNREVFAVPGSFFNPMAAGCHELLQNGAKLVRNVQDILEELPTQSTLLSTPTPVNKNKSHLKKLDADHRMLLECIGDETMTINQLAQGMGQPIDKIVLIISELELNGLIAHDIRGYTRIHYE